MFRYGIERMYRYACSPLSPSTGTQVTLGAVAPAPPFRPTSAVYRRRRFVAGVIVAGALSAIGLAASDVLAGPGGEPASAAGARQTSTRSIVTARRGDSLWTIAERAYAADAHAGSVRFATYLDAVIELNGGTELHAGQQVRLP